MPSPPRRIGTEPYDVAYAMTGVRTFIRCTFCFIFFVVIIKSLFIVGCVAHLCDIVLFIFFFPFAVQFVIADTICEPLAQFFPFEQHSEIIFTSHLAAFKINLQSVNRGTWSVGFT
jgi:hypothetical protein